MLVGVFGIAGVVTLTSRVLAQQEVRPAQAGRQTPVPSVVIPDLLSANEASVKAAWTKLKEQLAEAEATSPEAVIPLYGQFLDQGGAKYASIAIDVASRVAGLYATDLHQFDKAIEAYDWGIATYRRDPGVSRLQTERLAAVKAQEEQERKNAQGVGASPLKIETPKTVVGIVVPMVKIPNSAVAPIGVPQVVAPPRFGSIFPQPSVSTPALTIPIVGVPGEAAKPLINSASVSPQQLPLVHAPFAPFNKPSLQQAMTVAPVAFTAPSLALPARPGNYLGWTPGEDRCVTAMARQRNGRLWVATEDSGVWYCDEAAPEATRWKQFGASDGLGDDSAYAIAVDGQDRVWVGTLNHGVSVWNGKAWKNYGVLDGPLGERVFDIAVCPTDGDVWIATNAGLTRYSQQDGNWRHLTRASGLLSHQIQAIAFAQDGTMVLGTGYDGVAIARAADNYKKWQIVRGPEQMPVAPTGTGLPGNLINDVLVASDGTIYVATTCGLAWSLDKGTSWNYMRGQDYVAKTLGLYNGPPVGWKPENGAILSEDYISCLAEDNAGNLWVGHWQKGNESIELQSATKGANKIKRVIEHEGSGYVRAILTSKDQSCLIARYDEGITQSALIRRDSHSGTQAKTEPGNPKDKGKVEVQKSTDLLAVAHPRPSMVPDRSALEALLKEVQAANESATPSTEPFVLPLDDDWTTQGDWLGRYGRHFAVLCAMLSPQDYVWGAGEERIKYDVSISPREKGNSLRYWVHWLYTDNRRALEMPTIYGDSRRAKGLDKGRGLRRQSEVDDNGEAYPLTKEGPNIYVSVEIPPGTYVLSFYNHNKDGNSGYNRARDYKISLRKHPKGVPLKDVTDFHQWDELASNRQKDFRGGVYQKYLVSGPQTLTVEYAKNNSINTILSSIMLDKVDERSGGEEPDPYFPQPSYFIQTSLKSEPNLPEAPLINMLWEALEEARKTNPAWWSSENRRFYHDLAQWYKSAAQVTNAREALIIQARLGSCYYYLNSFPLWEQIQRQRNLQPARDTENALRYDESTIKSNGSANFVGQGRRTVRNYLAITGDASSTIPLTPVASLTLKQEGTQIRMATVQTVSSK